jgi:hypothetical protein
MTAGESCGEAARERLRCGLSCLLRPISRLGIAWSDETRIGTSVPLLVRSTRTTASRPSSLRGMPGRVGAGGGPSIRSSSAAGVRGRSGVRVALWIIAGAQHRPLRQAAGAIGLRAPLPTGPRSSWTPPIALDRGSLLEVSHVMYVHNNDLTKTHGAHQSPKTSCPTRRCRVNGPERRVAIEEYTLLDGASGPYGIATGPDGALWFAEESGKIGRLVPA